MTYIARQYTEYRDHKISSKMKQWVTQETLRLELRMLAAETEELIQQKVLEKRRALYDKLKKYILKMRLVFLVCLLDINILFLVPMLKLGFTIQARQPEL